MLLTPCAQLMKSTECMPSMLMSSTCWTRAPCSSSEEASTPALNVTTPSSSAIELRFMGDSRVLAGRRDTRQARLRRHYGRDTARGGELAEREGFEPSKGF